MHVHIAQHRSAKIAEQMGTGLRYGRDAIELLIATRLAAPAGPAVRH